MAGVTLDSGALIGFERQNGRTLTHIKLAQELGHELRVPTPVIVEAWRGGPRSARIAALLDACVIEPLSAFGAACGRSHRRGERRDRRRCGGHGVRSKPR